MCRRYGYAGTVQGDGTPDSKPVTARNGSSQGILARFLLMADVSAHLAVSSELPEN
jgi:hypothetical protein